MIYANVDLIYFIMYVLNIYNYFNFVYKSIFNFHFYK